MLAVPGRAVPSGALHGSRNRPSLSRFSSSVNSDAAKKPIKTISDLPGPISLPIIGDNLDIVRWSERPAV